MTGMDRASERGFTLLEMVCVIALVAMLAAVLLALDPPPQPASIEIIAATRIAAPVLLIRVMPYLYV